MLITVWILDKIAKPFSETGLNHMLQGLRICFRSNPRIKGIESISYSAQPILPVLTKLRELLTWNSAFLNQEFYAKIYILNF